MHGCERDNAIGMFVWIVFVGEVEWNVGVDEMS